MILNAWLQPTAEQATWPLTIGQCLHSLTLLTICVANLKNVIPLYPCIHCWKLCIVLYQVWQIKCYLWIVNQELQWHFLPPTYLRPLPNCMSYTPTAPHPPIQLATVKLERSQGVKHASRLKLERNQRLGERPPRQFSSSLVSWDLGWKKKNCS